MSMTLKAARYNAGLTQEAMAMELNVTKKTVASWENGKTMPKADKIDAICKLLNVSYDNIRWKV